MINRRRYKNPPIQEALVEFQFAGSEEGDVTVFGELYALLKAKYPTKRVRHSVEHAIHVSPQGPVPLPPRSGIDRVQFLSADGTELVAIGVNVLSTHRLRPYTGWDKFSPRIAEALDWYRQVAGSPGVSRIGVRYINTLDCAQGLKSLNELLSIPVGLPSGFPDNLASFLMRFEARYDDRRRLLLTLARAPGESFGVVVDFDVIFQAAEGEPLGFDDALGEAEQLRDLEREAFELAITDTARETFDA
ncbi:MAG: TIGR04255 family protein [Proteobacteria bacterium]|nr:TIGR04255 family protein [Pseudomonadota bacterium]